MNDTEKLEQALRKAALALRAIHTRLSGSGGAVIRAQAAAYASNNALDAFSVLAEYDNGSAQPASVPADHPSASIGAWLSAALDDPKVCSEMKRDIRAWFDAGWPLISQPVSGLDGFIAERVNMGRGDERYIGTTDGVLGVTVRHGDPGEVRNDILWLIADAMLVAREAQP